MGILTFISLTALFQTETLPIQTKALFDYRQATPILTAPKKGSLAERLTGYAKTGNPNGAFVAEDGNAVAMLVGTFEMLDTKTGAAITENDQFRIEIRDGKMTAFNVSQETGIRKSYKGAVDINLKPIVVLDRYRILCVNGPVSLRMPNAPKLPEQTIFLALIDDSQRGPHPNMTRAIELHEKVDASGIWPVGFARGKYILGIASGSRRRFLAVDPKTLKTQWVKAPNWTSIGKDAQAIKRKTPNIRLFASTRWASKSYFLSHTEYGSEMVGVVWDGKVLRHTDPYFLVAASANGRYGWLVDRKTGNQWLLER